MDENIQDIVMMFTNVAMVTGCSLMSIENNILEYWTSLPVKMKKTGRAIQVKHQLL